MTVTPVDGLMDGDAMKDSVTITSIMIKNARMASNETETNTNDLYIGGNEDHGEIKRAVTDTMVSVNKHHVITVTPVEEIVNGGNGFRGDVITDLRESDDLNQVGDINDDMDRTVSTAL